MIPFAASPLQADELVEMVIASLCEWLWSCPSTDNGEGRVVFEDRRIYVPVVLDNTRIGKYPWLTVRA